jgi:type VI secretion system protein ImpB
MAGSVHDKLGRVRKARVDIRYDVEIGGAAVKQELPFVVGVLGDFSGNPKNPLQPLSKRKFVSIDRDNFSDVMGRMAPELNMKVENTLKGDKSEMSVALKFRSIEDFEPGRIAQQVEPLKELLAARARLQELAAKADVSDDLEALLDKVRKNPEDRDNLSAILDSDKGGAQ